LGLGSVNNELHPLQKLHELLNVERKENRLRKWNIFVRNVLRNSFACQYTFYTKFCFIIRDSDHV